MVAPNRDEKPIPAVGQLWAHAQLSRGTYLGIITSVGDRCAMLGCDGNPSIEVIAEGLASTDWQCVGLMLPGAAGRYKINVNVTAASGAGPGSVVSRVADKLRAVAAQHDAASDAVFAGNATALGDAGWLRRAIAAQHDAGAVFAVPQSATVTMTGPVDAAVRPHDVATSLRRFAERLGGPFAGLSAASRKHLATMCADAAHAIAALMEPRGGSPDGRVQRATDAARAAQHGAAIVASLVILETAGTMLGDEDEWVGQLSFQAAYACGLAAARRAQ